MRNKSLLLLLITFLAVTACSKKEEEKPQMATTNKAAAVKAAHKVTVVEVQNVTDYSYLKVQENNKEYWMAARKADFKVGQVLLYNKAMEMKDFESKELHKKFDSVFFVDDLSEQLGVGGMTQPQKPKIEREAISMKPAEDGVTIKQLFDNMNYYKGKTVKVKGKVSKINNGIMGKNWIHIQDGTSSGEDFDLTVTTNDMVGMGQVVTFEGKIATNKDFGYGYSYKVLLEDAKTYKSL